MIVPHGSLTEPRGSPTMRSGHEGPGSAESAIPWRAAPGGNRRGGPRWRRHELGAPGRHPAAPPGAAAARRVLARRRRDRAVPVRLGRAVAALPPLRRGVALLAAHADPDLRDLR